MTRAKFLTDDGDLVEEEPSSEARSSDSGNVVDNLRLLLGPKKTKLVLAEFAKVKKKRSDANTDELIVCLLVALEHVRGVDLEPEVRQQARDKMLDAAPAHLRHSIEIRFQEIPQPTGRPRIDWRRSCEAYMRKHGASVRDVDRLLRAAGLKGTYRE